MGSLFSLPKTKHSATKKYINSFSWHWTRQMCNSILVIRCRQWSRPVMKIRQWISRPPTLALTRKLLLTWSAQWTGISSTNAICSSTVAIRMNTRPDTFWWFTFLYHLQIINFRTQLTFMRPQQFAHSFFPRTRIHSQKEVLAFRYFIANIQKSEGR